MESRLENSLDRLTIKGFKSIKELNDFDLGNLNVFIGANGAGKSNLISFFNMLHAMMDGNLNDFVQNSGGGDSLLYNGPKETSAMFFELHFGSRGYRFTLKQSLFDGLHLTDESSYYQLSKGDVWWHLGQSVDGIPHLVKEVVNRKSDEHKSKPVLDAIMSWQIYHFHDTSLLAGMRRYEIIEDNRRLRQNASNIAPFLLRLREVSPSIYQEILQSIRLALPFFHDFLFQPEKRGDAEKVKLSWRQKSSDYPMQPYHLSDGSIRFICLVTALLQPDPPSTIVIDEPELGLHPQAISILAELMQYASERTQLVVATQSPQLIDNFDVDQIIAVNNRDGESIFERLNNDDLDVWLEKYSLGELWMKDVIRGGPSYG